MTDGNSTIFVGGNKWSVTDFARHIIKNNISEKTFTIFDVADLIAKYKNWMKKMPRIKPFYAVKCNNNAVVLKVLTALGAGFDCASEYEIQLALDSGVSPDGIIFANTAKPQDHLEFARMNRVDLLTFDNEIELFKIKHYYPNARLIVRIKNDALAALCPLGQKYGCCPDTEAKQLLAVARNLDLNVVGVSFHVGSGCKDDTAHARGIAKARKLFDFGKKIGHRMHILDIGGGFPGDVGSSIDEVGEAITKVLNFYFPIENEVEVIAEPGRYFVESAFTVTCCVHSARRTRKDDKSHIMYFLDNGIYGSFAEIDIHKFVLDPKPLDVDGAVKIHSSLWGPTCSGIDLIMGDVLLPKLPLPSWIFFGGFGAYASATATKFNGFFEPAEYSFATIDTLKELGKLECYKEYQENLHVVNLPEELPKCWQHDGPDVTHLYASTAKCPNVNVKERCGIFADSLRDNTSEHLSPI